MRAGFTSLLRRIHARSARRRSAASREHGQVRRKRLGVFERLEDRTLLAQFTVNSTADAPDLAPGNGLCATATGICTLRAAIQEANAHPNDASGPDSISLPAGTYTFTRTGANEDAANTGDLD